MFSVANAQCPAGCANMPCLNRKCKTTSNWLQARCLSAGSCVGARRPRYLEVQIHNYPPHTHICCAVQRHVISRYREARSTHSMTFQHDPSPLSFPACYCTGHNASPNSVLVACHCQQCTDSGRAGPRVMTLEAWWEHASHRSFEIKGFTADAQERIVSEICYTKIMVTPTRGGQPQASLVICRIRLSLSLRLLRLWGKHTRASSAIHGRHTTLHAWAE